MSAKAAVDVTSIDHFAVNNDVEIKIVRDENGEVAVLFAVEDVIVKLFPVEQWLSYITHDILEDAQALRERGEQKETWRQKNKD
jgi:hypothetical protein